MSFKNVKAQSIASNMDMHDKKLPRLSRKPEKQVEKSENYSDIIFSYVKRDVFEDLAHLLIKEHSSWELY